jgi:hypothetical protein
MRRVIWLLTPTVLWIGGGIICLSWNNDVRQTAEPLVTEPSAYIVEMANKKPKRHKSPGIDQLPAEVIKAGRRTTCLKIHKFINCLWNKEELPEQCKESITTPIYKKNDKIRL